MSLSDLKRIDVPEWIDPEKGEPTLMLFSVVDDRSVVACQEYQCVYGEDAGSALRFLYAAMAPKPDPGLPLQGRPKMFTSTTAWWPKAGFSRTSCYRWTWTG